jgi:hypothetical protein
MSLICCDEYFDSLEMNSRICGRVSMGSWCMAMYVFGANKKMFLKGNQISTSNEKEVLCQTSTTLINLYIIICYANTIWTYLWTMESCLASTFCALYDSWGLQHLVRCFPPTSFDIVERDRLFGHAILPTSLAAIQVFFEQVTWMHRTCVDL